MLKKLLLTSLMCLPVMVNAQNIDLTILHTLSHTNNSGNNLFTEDIQKIDVDKDDYDSFNMAVNKLINSYESEEKYTFSDKEKQLILLTIFAQKNSQHQCLTYKDHALKFSSSLNLESPSESKCINKYNQDSFDDINSASYVINMNYIITPLQDRANQKFIDGFVKKVVADKGSK